MIARSSLTTRPGSRGLLGSRRARTLGAVVATVALTATGFAAAAPKASPAPRFNKPVRLTEPFFGGYEPSIKVDSYNNVFITAHKANHTIFAGKDQHGLVPVRGASFLWWTPDAGKTVKNLPSLTPAEESKAFPAAEGDFAIDDADRLYFVDTYLGDNSLSRWSSEGNDEVTQDFSRPVQGTGSVDDRPWLAAHGDGVVMYLGNAGSPAVGQNNGRYTVYMSYDGANTFDPVGINLEDSGWCYGAADHREASKDLYVLCTNDQDTLYAYSSHDDGKSFQRTVVGEFTPGASTETYPSVSVGPDGTVWALYNDKTDEESSLGGTRLRLYSSRNGGKTWRQQDVTPREGFHHYTWLDVARDGTVGIAYYGRQSAEHPWHLYAATAKPDRKGVLPRLTPGQVSTDPVSDDGSPHGDFFQAVFGPDNKLNVAYTDIGESDLAGIPTSGLDPVIYYAKQR